MRSAQYFLLALILCLFSVPTLGHGSSSEESETPAVEIVHAILNVISWGILMDVGIIISKFFKGRKITYRNKVVPIQTIHGIIMTTVVIISSIAIILLLARSKDEEEGEENEDSKSASEKFHNVFGLVIWGLSFVNLFGGSLSYIFMKNYNRSIKSKLSLPKMHKLSGSFLYVLTKVNIIVGAFVHAETIWKILVTIFLGLMAPLIIVSPGVYRRSFKKPAKIAEIANIPSSNPIHKKLINAINSGESAEEIIRNFPGFKWVMLENNVYDLTDWIHPAGNFSIEPCIGREIGRYFYGNYALEGSRIKSHKHSGLSLSQLTTFYIGQKSHPESIILSRDTQKEVSCKFNDIWKISSIKMIPGSISQIEFSNPNYVVKNFGTSLSWLGSHFKVSFEKNVIEARMYTAALCLTEENLKLRKGIYEHFEKSVAGIESSFNLPADYLQPRESLPLFIKIYSFPKSFTKAIHKMGVDTRIRIEGPIEGNITFAPKAKGSYCIICAGTGILAVIDFLNTFLWRNLYRVLKDKVGADKAKQINVLDIPLDLYFNELKVDFIGAFRSRDEILGLDIVQKLAEVSKKYGLNNFGARIKGYSDDYIEGVKEHFSFEFIRNNVSLAQEAYYVVGPRKLNEEVTESLIKLGVPKNKIVLL